MRPTKSKTLTDINKIYNFVQTWDDIGHFFRQTQKRFYKPRGDCFKMHTIVLATYADRSEDGTIDHQATCERFAADLYKFEAQKELDEQNVSEAVHAVLDTEEYKGKRQPMPALIQSVLTRLNVQASNYQTLQTKVHEFIQENSQGKTAADGTEERPLSQFLISKGKGGGVGRRADLPAKTAKKA